MSHKFAFVAAMLLVSCYSSSSIPDPEPTKVDEPAPAPDPWAALGPKPPMVNPPEDPTPGKEVPVSASPHSPTPTQAPKTITPHCGFDQNDPRCRP